MAKLYLSFKDAVRRVIDKHFSQELAKRFTIRMDSEIWRPKWDEGVWQRRRNNTERLHVLFDGIDIFELARTRTTVQAEVDFLKAFKAAVEDGIISIEKKAEFVAPDTAKKRRRERKKESRDNLKKAFKESLAKS